MPIPEKVSVVQRQLLSEEVYSLLHEWIITGVLAPGEKIRDAELSQRLGVSRTPVREALRRLKDENLIDTEANRWTRVTPVDFRDAERVYPIVWALESLAVSVASSGLTPAELEGLHRANAQLLEAMRVGDYRQASKADVDFHRIIVEASENIVLVKVWSEMQTTLRRHEHAYFGGGVLIPASHSEHTFLLSALNRDDFQGAASAIQEDWRKSLSRIRAHVGQGIPVTTHRGEEEVSRVKENPS